jgi:branched-chain amino acid transport system ATP-binding protein
VLEVRNLTAGYGDVPVLWDVSLSVPDRKVVALIGANGVGKTTLLRAISGVISPSSGSILVGDVDVTGLAAHQVAAHGVAHVPEGRQLFPQMTVRENLVMGAYLPQAKAHRTDSMERVFTLFPRLRERQEQFAGSLSGGEQQMLAIGRGLLLQPRLLMLDEPSLGLGPLLVSEIFVTVERLRSEGMTILVVEQNVQQALHLAETAYVLENGRIVLQGRAQDLLEDPSVRTAYLGLTPPAGPPTAPGLPRNGGATQQPERNP